MFYAVVKIQNPHGILDFFQWVKLPVHKKMPEKQEIAELQKISRAGAFKNRQNALNKMRELLQKSETEE